MRHPWSDNPDLSADHRPVELFPEYNVPKPAPIDSHEQRLVDYFLLVREQIHSGPLYTQARTSNTTTTRAYGQDQINARYREQSKATVDPFTSMPSYSRRFEKNARALPDLSERPFALEIFPPELRPLLEAPKGQKRKRALMLSEVTSLKTAEEIFSRSKNGEDDMGKRALEQLDRLANADDEGGNAEIDLIEDEEGGYDEEDDEVYSDEDGGDYDAEQHFDGGSDFGDDGDDDEGGGGDEY